MNVENLIPAEVLPELPEAMRRRYKVVAQLGEGAFGITLLVTDRASNQKYVAKIMDLSQMMPKDKQQIKKEVDGIGQCDHVNVLRHIETYANETHLVVVTEYADGGDLSREIISRDSLHLNQPFTSAEIADIFAQICLGLEHIHSEGVLHRGIKPANIFFTRSGVKIGDFGFSKHHEETMSNVVGHTLSSTPYYLAPEMWRGEEYSKKADAWSAGVLLFEMMMLERPFTGDSMKQLSDAVCKGTIPAIPAGDFDDELAQALDDQLVQTCNLLLSTGAVDRPEFQEVLKFRIFQL